MTIVFAHSLSTRLIFDFRASNPNGIMLYTANPTQLDFIVCHLEDGKVACSFCAGDGILTLTTPNATYSDGNWHTVCTVKMAFVCSLLSFDNMYSQVKKFSNRSDHNYEKQ